MDLYLAMSCLQGRPMQSAFDELTELAPDGIQLTAGNAPTYDFNEHVTNSGMPTRTHHGFSLSAIRQPVWTEDFEITGSWDSVHPPRKAIADWIPKVLTDIIFETMYPGYPLGTGEAVVAAMKAKLPLAVDVSHVFIQIEQGAMDQSTWKQLQDYTLIKEIHVSANNGQRDSHQKITRDTFGLDWVRNRAEDCDIPVVLESYFHKLSKDDRTRQMDVVRGIL